MPRSGTGLASIFGAALIAATLAGCAGPRPVDPASARAFPEGLQQARVLDIQVRRAPTTLTLTNTTASDIPACTMWLNKRYSREFPGLPVGRTATLTLSDFVDEYGERFRPGGFWATRRSQRVVLAQFEIPSDSAGGVTLIGAIVIDGEEDPDVRRRRAAQF